MVCFKVAVAPGKKIKRPQAIGQRGHRCALGL
jgi:hypothetical protein